MAAFVGSFKNNLGSYPPIRDATAISEDQDASAQEPSVRLRHAPRRRLRPPLMRVAMVEEPHQATPKSVHPHRHDRRHAKPIQVHVGGLPRTCESQGGW